MAFATNVVRRLVRGLAGAGGQAVTEYAIALGVLVGVAIAAANTGIAQAVVDKVAGVLSGL
jgi:hypothetical protein